MMVNILTGMITFASLLMVLTGVIGSLHYYRKMNSPAQQSHLFWERMRDAGLAMCTVITTISTLIEPGNISMFPTRPQIELGTAIRVKMDLWFGRAIYYTLDGSDPQDSGILYNGSILLDRNTYLNQYVTITVRSNFLGVWSQPVSRTYYVTSAPQCDDSPIKFLFCPGVPNTPAPLVEGAAL